MDQDTAEKGTYSKRPLWQWIVLYVILGVIVYGVIYAVFFYKKNASSYTNMGYVSPTMAVKPTQQPGNGVYKMMEKDKLGMVMTDLKGMTLYTFAKDTTGVSNCTGKCLANWPAYVAPANATNLPANITVITRPDGTLQYAWKGMPLYYYIKDGDSGDAYGNGIGGVWSVVQQ